jgi:hypothetical protein
MSWDKPISYILYEQMELVKEESVGIFDLFSNFSPFVYSKALRNPG